MHVHVPVAACNLTTRNTTTKNITKEKGWDFPGGPVIENLPSNAGDPGSIPGQVTKIPHATGQPSPCDTTT